MTGAEFRSDSIEIVSWNDPEEKESAQTFILSDEILERLKAGKFVTFVIYGEYGINIAYRSKEKEK